MDTFKNLFLLERLDYLIRARATGCPARLAERLEVSERTFFICPPGTGCRIGEDAQKIVLSPNPASSVVRLLHFEMDAGREYRLTVADLTGRVVYNMTLTSNEVDISGFDKGMYAVTIEQDGKRIFTDKLVINK